MLREFFAYNTILFARPKTIERFHLLKKAQHWDEIEIRAYKETLLRNILEHAYNNVKYYKDILDPYKDCWKGDKFDWEVFNAIPVLEKNTVKENFQSLISRQIDTMNAIENRSGGSTGLPTRHMQEEHFRQMDMANNLLFKYWGGVKAGNKNLLIAADDRDYFGFSVSWRKKLIDKLFNKKYFNLFNLKEEAFYDFVRLMEKEKPVYVQVYASAAYEMAQFILRNGISIPPPRMLMCIAGTIYGEMLDVIEEAFRCRAYSRYGSRETGDMAGMCENRIYHEMSFSHHIDILDDNNRPVEPGETGHIVVTVLTNRAMPLIRFKIGDMGIWSGKQCKCGIRFKTLEKVVGRTGEVFRNSKGKIILPELFIHLIGVSIGDLSDEVIRFQVAQIKQRLIEVRFVLKGNKEKEFKKRSMHLEYKIKKIMDDEVSVKIVFLKDIPPLPSGKYCYTVSNIGQ